MTSLTEQLSAVRQSQWNAQLDLINRLGSRTLDRSEQLIELNIKTSRASVEQAAGVVRQLFDVREPRDLFALGAHAQDQWQQLFAYGRALMGIAVGAGDDVSAQAPTLRLLPAPSATVPLTPSQVAGQVAIAVAAGTTVASEIAGAAADIGGAVADATLDAAERAAPAAAPVIDTVEANVAAADDAVSGAVTAAEAATASVAEAATQAAGTSAPAAAPDADTDADAAATAAPVVAVEAHPAPAQSVDAVLENAIADAGTALPARAKPLVEALHDATHAPAGLAHPLASTVTPPSAGPVELPHVAPAEPAPAVPSQGPATATRERRTTKRK